MTNEYVETLYGKYEKKVAKKNRAELKRALASGRDDKFEAVNNLQMKELHPLRKPKGFIGWVATFLGCLFLVLNLIVYAYAVPVYNGYGNLAGKVGTDLEAYSAKANGDLEAKVNEALEAGVNSAYIGGVEKAQAYLNKLDNSSYRRVSDLQNMANGAVTAYSDYQKAAAVYQEKYTAKTTAESGYEAAKAQYETQKENYLSLLAEYESALIAFAEEKGAFNQIPAFVYADLQTAYDTATEAYNTVLAKYAEEELTALRTSYENATTDRDAAKEAYEEAQELLIAATALKVEDDEEVISAKAVLQQALDEYAAQIDVGTYDLTAYKEAVDNAQAALNAATEAAQTAINEKIKAAQDGVNSAKTVLDEAETALQTAKTAIAEVLNAEETVAAAEKRLNDAKEKYQALSQLEKAELVFANSDEESKKELTEKKGEVAKAEAAAMPLINAEKALAAAVAELSEAEASLTETQNELFGIMDEIVKLSADGFNSGDLFDKISSDYKTTVNAYLTLLTEQKDIKDPQVVIDRFLEKNLSVFDTAINGLTDFLTYAYSLEVYGSDIENYAYSEYGALNNAIDTALSEFQAKYGAYTDAQAAYERLYRDYAALCEEYSTALDAYNATQNEENKEVLDVAESALNLAEVTYRNSLVSAVSEVALTKAQANAYLNRLNNYISVYGRIATEAKSILNEANLYISELTGIEQDERHNPIINGELMLDYIFADEGTINAVLGRYDLGSCVERTEAYVAAVNAYRDYINGLDEYADCGALTDGDLSELARSADIIKSVCDEFDSVTKKINSDGGSLYSDSKGYASSAQTFSIIMMVYNIILAVVLLAYFLYWVLWHRSEAMEENYNSIINAIKD